MIISLNSNPFNTKTPTRSGRKCKYSGQSVRALPLRILTVGRRRSQGVQLLVEEYRDKLKHYCSVDDIQIRSNPKNSSDLKAQVEREDMAVMQHIKSEDWVVMLDEHGLDIDSEQMAELMGDAGETGSSRLLFCIGGPYGHGPQLRDRANVTIRVCLDEGQQRLRVKAHRLEEKEHLKNRWLMSSAAAQQKQQRF